MRVLGHTHRCERTAAQTQPTRNAACAVCPIHVRSGREPAPTRCPASQRKGVPQERREPAVKYHYLHRRFTHRVVSGTEATVADGPSGPRARPPITCLRVQSRCEISLGDPGGRDTPNRKPRDTDQSGSLAGAARLLQDNAGVLKHRSDGTEILQGGAGQRRC